MGSSLIYGCLEVRATQLVPRSQHTSFYGPGLKYMTCLFFPLAGREQHQDLCSLGGLASCSRHISGLRWPQEAASLKACLITLLSGHLENLISFFIIQHFIHNKYKLFTATVKKAHLHGGFLWALTCAWWCWVIRPGEKGYLFIFFLKRRHIFTTLFLKIKLAALPKNILKYNKRVQITLRLWETQIQGQFG